jgi:hypothetical protein
VKFDVPTPSQKIDETECGIDEEENIEKQIDK